MGGLYGAPRILQSIAEQKVIRIMDILATGVGSSVAGILLTLRSGVVMWCGNEKGSLQVFTLYDSRMVHLYFHGSVRGSLCITAAKLLGINGEREDLRQIKWY